MTPHARMPLLRCLGSHQCIHWPGQRRCAMSGCNGPCRYDAVDQLKAPPNNRNGGCDVDGDIWVQSTLNINSLGSNAEAQSVTQEVTNVFDNPTVENGAQVSSMYMCCAAATWQAMTPVQARCGACWGAFAKCMPHLHFVPRLLQQKWTATVAAAACLNALESTAIVGARPTPAWCGRASLTGRSVNC